MNTGRRSKLLRRTGTRIESISHGQATGDPDPQSAFLFLNDNTTRLSSLNRLELHCSDYSWNFIASGIQADSANHGRAPCMVEKPPWKNSSFMRQETESKRGQQDRVLKRTRAPILDANFKVTCTSRWGYIEIILILTHRREHCGVRAMKIDHYGHIMVLRTVLLMEGNV
ncbi:hypothetical protein J6590_085987 [Homalodisca vitripennis]|nr:hypothetical protein J6590_085987 [Homalodisca vitripennis]